MIHRLIMEVNMENGKIGQVHTNRRCRSDSLEIQSADGESRPSGNRLYSGHMIMVKSIHFSNITEI